MEVSANRSGRQDASSAFNDGKDDSETRAGVRGAGDSEGFSCDDKLSDGPLDARRVELEESTAEEERETLFLGHSRRSVSAKATESEKDPGK